MQLRHNAKVISFDGYGPDAGVGRATTAPDDPAFERRILCEGDSWFPPGATRSSKLLFPLIEAGLPMEMPE